MTGGVFVLKPPQVPEFTWSNTHEADSMLPG
jgi:hypothetical protein